MSIRQFYRILTVLYLLISVNGLSQKDFTKEQLYNLLNKPQTDTVLIDAYTELCWPVYANENLDSSVYFGQKAIKLSTKINDIKRLSIIHRRIGIAYLNFGKDKNTLFHEEESYLLSEKINFKKGMQLALNNTGVVYLNNQLYNKALTYFLRSLKIVDETKDYKTASNLFINCGKIYANIGRFDKAEEFFFKANNNAKAQNDLTALITSYCELSAIARHKGKTDLAILYLDRAKNELKNNQDKKLLFIVSLSEGLIYSEKKNNQKALEIFKNLLKITNNKSDLLTAYVNIGDEYLIIKQNDSTLFYYNKAYQIAFDNQMYTDLEYLSYRIANLYEKKENYKKFSEFIELHLNFKDSNEKVNKAQTIISQQLEYDFTKKQIADSVSYAHKEQINTAKVEALNAKSKIDKLIRIALIVFVLVIAFVAFFIYSRLKLTSKQNKIIEQQKKLVEEKQKEILDSINYAKRIQTAILPQEKYIQRKLNEHKKD